MRRVLKVLKSLRRVPDAESTVTGNSKKVSVKAKIGGVTTTTESGTQCSDIQWHNLKRVLLLCGGQQVPPSNACVELESDLVNIVEVLEAQRFVHDVFQAMNVPDAAASEMSDALVAADYMGHRSMGIHRLPAIAADLLSSTIDSRQQPKVLNEREATALVDGQNAPGPVVANYCMDLAMRKAKNQGIGYVAARHSNSIGMASWYACQALCQRMIGICMSNGPPLLVPGGGTEPLLGNNCIGFCAGTRQEQFLMDLGMSTYPIEQLELEYCNGQLKKLPDNLALNCSGQPTNSVADALRAQRLRPFAPEHKGFGLAAMVDILCGVMTGARYATHLRRRGLFDAHEGQADLGQVYIAIDPKHFCVSFEERLADFHKLLRNVVPLKSGQPTLVPGDLELQHMQMVDNQGGLALTPCTLSVLQELGESLNIHPLRTNTNKN